MELTPNDVEQKAFTQALRGYQMDEVDDFLDEIVATLRASEQRLRDAEEKVRALEAEATTRGGDETTISRAILVAQRSADALLADARGEADRIAREAKAETEVLRSEREMERGRLQGEIDGMRERVSGLRAALTHLSAAVSGEVVEMEDGIEAVAVELQPETVPDVGEGPGQSSIAPIATMDDDAFTPMFDPGEGQASGDTGHEQAETGDQSHHDNAEGESPDPNHNEEGPDHDSESSDHDSEDAASRVVARPWERG